MFPLLWGVEEAPPASGVPEPPSPAGWLTDASGPGTEAGSPELALVLILVLPLTGSAPPAPFPPPSEKCVKKYQHATASATSSTASTAMGAAYLLERRFFSGAFQSKSEFALNIRARSTGCFCARRRTMSSADSATTLPAPSPFLMRLIYT